MNVTIIGYGKMGKEIENVLISRGHNINKIIDKDSEISFENTEVAIIFTSPEATFEQIKNCLDVACKGVKGVCIIDGRVKSSILFELLSEKGSGTLIRE